MIPGIGQKPPAGGKRWLPLESNPQVLNEFSRSIGISNKWEFHDVFGTDPELLAFIPTPVIAVMLLFPISEASEAFRAKQIASITETPQTLSKDLWFCKQTIGNACGTMGVLHAAINTESSIDLDGWIKSFKDRTFALDPAAKAAALETDDELDTVHADAAQRGQTRPPAEDESVLLHFVSFVCVDGCLYEMDGRKPQPINHGATSRGSLLSDAIAVIQEKFISVDPESVNFNIMALAPAMAE
eukprot:CAMPEP_0173393222 /NCGR_PEP_ID=MMETSP1356-20130122/21983_1 /TAXON_ID=77927 ORGANISM="Hemiselmis virescens, Strain PCC157" /NCGR_SAMPLE_ID=MMETSP1356 /ASSEMBLY_ACC=CAM_ASM_000847 /LENGTH=242 /DNA_ID=CAMNT_0014351209 /DNA_START=21 /DNA_END=749 /DNA_ORIENTATION=-